MACFITFRRGDWNARRLRSGLAAIVCGLSLAPPVNAEDNITVAACGLKTIGPAAVRAFDGVRTFTLTDGRTLRLAAVELPLHGDAALAASKAINDLVGANTVMLAQNKPMLDRYGRLIAFVFLPDGHSLQERLIEAGHARVAARTGLSGCNARLFALETAARTAKRGLWARAAFAPQMASKPRAILARQGQFTLVEGHVLSVRSSGATIYVNFGRRWTRDFTVTILRRNRALFSAAGMEPEHLQGRWVRVRGVVEERGGPLIAAAAPEQIELITAP
jgi:endonuclease YncB( thermonuclease family)